MNPFSFALRQPVKLKGSGEVGHVIGRAEFAESVPSYQVRFVAGDGCLTEAWWPASAIEGSATETADAAA